MGRVLTGPEGPGPARHPDGERRALPHLRCDLQIVSEELADGAADGESQPRSAVLPRRGAVGLLERLEDGLEPVLRDSDTRILHGDAPDLVPAPQDPDRDPPPGGELEGVPDQVDQHLPKLAGVRLHRRQAVRRLPGQRDVLGPRLALELGQRLRHEVGHRDGRHLEFHPAGFDLGEIQDLVDQGEEVSTVGQHALQKAQFPLPQGPRLVLQQDVGEADHGIQRRAELVTHVRQELALGPIRPFRFLLGHAERLFGPDPPGHVLPEHDRRRDAGAPGDGVTVDLEDPLLARHGLLLELGEPLPAEDPGVELPVPGGVGRLEELLRQVSDGGLPPRAGLQGEGEGRVEGDQAHLAVHGPDAVPGALHHGGEFGPGGREFGLGGPLLRDVPEDGLDGHGPPVLDVGGGAPRADDGPSLTGAELHLDHPSGPGGEDLVEEPDHPLPVARSDDPGQGQAGGLLGRVAHGPLPRRVDVQQGPVRRGAENEVVGGVEEALETLLAPLQDGLRLAPHRGFAAHLLVHLAEGIQGVGFPAEGHADSGQDSHEDGPVPHELQDVSPGEQGIEGARGSGGVHQVAGGGEEEELHEPPLEDVFHPPRPLQKPDGGQGEEAAGDQLEGPGDEGRAHVGARR